MKTVEKELKPGRFLKQHMFDEYAQTLKDSSYLIVTEMKGLTNKDIESLKKKLRHISCQCLVVKNSLCKIALKNLNIEGVSDMVTGSCALGYGRGDAVAVSKIFVDFTKDNKNLVVKGGYIDSKVVSIDIIKQLAALPSREVLLTRLVSCLNSPIAGFVMTCSGILKKFLYAINEISKQKEKKDSV